jgi:low temperature requirement protein LtrA
MAASVATAFGAGGPVFVVGLGIIYLLAVATMALGVEAGSGVQQSLVRWVVPNLGALALLLVGGFVASETTRTVLWVAALAVVLAAMLAAGRGDWIIRSGHFAERHGLIVIVALGEVIVAIGRPVVDALESGGGLPGLTVLALVSSGLFAALLWWSYFDRLAPALEHKGEEVEGDRERGRYVRDVYTWGHLPLVAGIILAAAALEEITLHPGDAVEPSFRLMMFAGLALSVVGATASVWRAFRAIARERVVAVAVLGAVLLVGGELDGIVLLLVNDAVVASTLAVEHHRIER